MAHDTHSFDRSACRCGCGQSTSVPRAEYVRGHRPAANPAATFWSKVDKQPDGGCWLWCGNLTEHGYGRFWHPVDKLNVYAHRYSFALTGPLDPTLTIDHLCRVRSCVNPAHLEEVSLGENARRAMAVRPLVTECKRGHAYDDKNTIVNAMGYRECRTCTRERRRVKR